MEVTAKLRYLRIAPRKVREVIDLIRGKKVDEAQNLLEFLVRKSAKPVLKLLKGVIASARHDFQLDQSNLYISKILVDEGPKLKRWRPASRGRTAPIMKRTSHITIILDEIKKVSAAKKGIKKPPSVKVSARKPEKITEKPPKEAKLSTEKPKFKPERREVKRPKKEIGLKRIFKRKAF